MHPDAGDSDADVLVVQQQFDRRARGFAAHEAVVREASSRLMERLDLMRHEARMVLDVGCGAGASREPLRLRYPGAQWLGVDVSQRMMMRGAYRSGWGKFLLRRRRNGNLFACASAERLPIADESVDLVFSNLMLQWHPAPDRALREMARVLRPGGLLLLSAFGPDTARELRESFLQELPRARPLPFPDMHDLGDMLMAAGVVAPVMECEPLRLVYPDVRALLREARALGGNPRPDRMRGLPSGRAARAVLRNLQGRREPDGRVALSFELVFGHGWKGRAAHAHGAAAAAGAWQTVKFGGRTP